MVGSASLDSSLLELDFTFSAAVAAGSLAANQIIVHGTGSQRWGNDAQAYASGTSMALTMHTLSTAAGSANTYDYNATPANFVGTNGLPVAAWTDLSCTIF